MDRISNANGSIWIFTGIVVFYLLAVIFSLGIWAKGEKMSRTFYFANVIVTAIISFSNMEIVFGSAAYETDFFGFLFYGKIFAILGALTLCGSILFQKRDSKILGNVLLNLSTTGGLLLFAYLMKVKY